MCGSEPTLRVPDAVLVTCGLIVRNVRDAAYIDSDALSCCCSQRLHLLLPFNAYHPNACCNLHIDVRNETL
jgi:hypothetical protein